VIRIDLASSLETSMHLKSTSDTRAATNAVILLKVVYPPKIPIALHYVLGIPLHDGGQTELL
jgi:hypothetical protein